MIYDCFPFFNEFEVLELRLNELYNVVDKFVICESNFTHQGKPKPLFFLENKEKFKKFEDKIIHLVFDAKNIKGDNKHWKREMGQRNYLKTALKKCKNEDIILLSDVDEIPDAKLLAQNLSKLKEYDILTFAGKFYLYKFNLCIGGWNGTAVALWKTVKWIKNLCVFRGLRDKEEKKKVYFIKGGWHFSFIGDVSKIQYKFDSYTHAKDFPEGKDMKTLVENNLYWNNQKLTKEKLDDSFPEYLLRNEDKFKDLIS